MTLIIRSSILLLVACALASCNIDSSYSRLAATAEADPPKDALVGMWHRKNPEGWGVKVRQSILVNRDGTGMELFYLNSSGLVTPNQDSNLPFTWRHDGHGHWTIDVMNGKAVWKCRYSNGKLLRYAGNTGPLRVVAIAEVFERVSP